MSPKPQDPVESIPLWLLHDDEVEAWVATQPATVGAWINEHNFKGERHRVVLVPDASGKLRLAVGGLGKRQGSLSLWHGAGFAERLPARRFHLAQSWSDTDATQLGLGFVHGAYRFDRYRPCAKTHAATLALPANADRNYIAIAGDAQKLVRDLINTAANDLGPAELSAAARKVAVGHAASVREWVGDELLSAGFPAIHAVGRASASQPRLVDILWAPAAAAALPRVTLIGKGVCFDSGGLDIKPSAGMALMKKDMGGAAVALGLADMLMRSRIAAEVRVLLPAVENCIGGNAYRPGDVLSTRKGLTVEVGNTDAEGRLVLCDALALADAERPDIIVDFATLTGAARVALGPELPALFGSNEATVGEVLRFAAAEHDPLWHLPLWMGYDDELGSKVADLNNIAASGFAGAIFAALYLKRFVTETSDWLHVDLYAWNSKERPGRSVGAEAHAMRAFHRFLMHRFGQRPG